MKKIYIIIATGLMIAGLSSCSQDSLDIPQKGVIELEKFYAEADDDDAVSAIAAIYKVVYNAARSHTAWYIPMHARSDDGFAGSAFTDSDNLQQFANYNIVVTNTTVRTMYQNFYRLIYWSNLIIEKMPSDTDVKRRVHAEAKAVRAFCHMDLIRLWGNPVKVDKVLSPDETTPENTPAAETWQLIESDLNEAINGLPSKSGQNGQVAIGGRLTREAALALLGKAQMWQGKNAEAAATLNRIITSNLYDLIPDRQNVWRPAGDFSPEYLWEHNAVDNAANWLDQGDGRYVYWGWRSDNVNTGNAGLPAESWGFGAVSADFAQFLLSHDGGKSDRWKALIADYEDILAMGSTGVWSPPVTNNQGYFRLIGIGRNEDMINPNYGLPMNARSALNIPYIRYTEVLLMYAEMQLAANNDSDGSGLAALNKVRTRVGLAPLATYTLQAVKDEKRAEMYFEGERYLDLLRWGDAPALLKDKGKTWYSFYGYIPGTTDWDVREMPGPGTGWTERYSLLPFPAEELNANPNLVQNDGW